MIFVVEAVTDVFPVFTAVGGVHQRAVRAHGEAAVDVLEPDVEQRRFTFEVFELLGPGQTAVCAGEDLRVMADRPAVFVVDKIHSRQQLPARHLGLLPGFALVIGIENVPAIADRDQACASVDDIEYQAFRGFGGFGGIDHIGRRLGGNHRCR
ncbi:hypothetical protein D3C78_1343770 [compost metagenome]